MKKIYNFFPTQIALPFIGILLSILSIQSLQAQTPDLNDNGSEYEINYSGSYEDYLIPSATNAQGINFFLSGGDGGHRMSCNGKADGGSGTRIETRFLIGTGTNQLQPGGTIRFIVGQKGQNHNSNDGGGTASFIRSNIQTPQKTGVSNAKWRFFLSFCPIFSSYIRHLCPINPIHENSFLLLIN